MTTSHLINAINYCRKAHATAALDIPYPSFQGEMAQYYAEAAWHSAVEGPAEDTIDGMQDLIDELNRRKKCGIATGEEDW